MRHQIIQHNKFCLNKCLLIEKQVQEEEDQDLVYSNTRAPTQVNTSPTRVNTNQHESATSQHESNTSPTRVNTNQHQSKTGLDKILLKI